VEAARSCSHVNLAIRMKARDELEAKGGRRGFFEAKGRGLECKSVSFGGSSSGRSVVEGRGRDVGLANSRSLASMSARGKPGGKEQEGERGKRGNRGPIKSVLSAVKCACNVRV
jgi:hypothetical protein